MYLPAREVLIVARKELVAREVFTCQRNICC